MIIFGIYLFSNHDKLQYKWQYKFAIQSERDFNLFEYA